MIVIDSRKQNKQVLALTEESEYTGMYINTQCWYGDSRNTEFPRFCTVAVLQSRSSLLCKVAQRQMDSLLLTFRESVYFPHWRTKMSMKIFLDINSFCTSWSLKVGQTQSRNDGRKLLTDNTSIPEERKSQYVLTVKVIVCSSPVIPT